MHGFGNIQVWIEIMEKKDFKLMNIITEEIQELEREWWKIDQIVDKLLCNKLRNDDDISENEFINLCLED